MSDEPEKEFDYIPETLDNPTETSDNLTIGEGTQLQETEELDNNLRLDNSETEIAIMERNIRREITVEMQRNYAKWYDLGANAKKRGYSRLSPFYERPTADYFFYCGFDGVKFEDAVVNLEDSMKQQEQSNG